MCGIAGTLGVGDDGRLESMLECLVHRGPDDDGIFRDESSGILMGMRRLSIIDHTSGAQPIYNENGSIVVVFNGEIYNYKELRERLVEAGHNFSSNSDTEVLVHLWEEYGQEMVTHLNGMFAFSLWDRSQEALFIARDRIGIKPLYYSTNRGTIIFGSNIQTLLRGGVNPILDEQSVYDYFELRAVPSSNTLLTNVQKLEPGHTLLVTDGKVNKRQYWRPPKQATNLSRSEIVSDIRTALEASVKRRLRADVPVGVFLSGGLDSTAIVALMAQQGNKVKTFSIGFNNAELDESGEAEFVASHFDTEHRTLNVDLTSTDLFERLMHYNGEPVADPAMIPTLLLAAKATEDVKVVLTGEGADELFGGYRHHEVMQRHRQIAQHLPSPLFTLAANASRIRYGGKYLRYAAGLKSDRALMTTLARDFRQGPAKYLNIKHSETLERLLDDTFEVSRPEIGHRQLVFDLEHNLPERLLYKVDVTTMANGLEARVPFLDHNLVELASRIPDEIRLKGQYKPLLRDAIKDIVPDRTLSRSKRGFNPPVAEWLRNPGLQDIWLNTQRIKDTPFLDTDAVESLLQKHNNGTDCSHYLWKIVSYIAWYHTIILPYESDGKEGR